jgi:hypothetical protein
MSELSTARILGDSELADVSEDELRAHYSLIAERYRQLRPEQVQVDAEGTIRAFARFAGCKPNQVTYVEAAEAGGWWPLSDEERQSIVNS